MRHIMAPAAALVVMSLSAMASADVKSGLQVGDSAGAFQVKDITGPRKGTSLCYR